MTSVSSAVYAKLLIQDNKDSIIDSYPRRFNVNDKSL